MIGYKAFNSDFTCLNKKFQVGKSYHENQIALCVHGFHFCKNLKDVFRFYGFDDNTIVAIVEASGTILHSVDKLKYVTSDIKIVKQLDLNSEQVRIAAIESNPSNLLQIQNPSEADQLAAVQHFGESIYFIKDPSNRVQIAALKQNKYVIDYIDNPCEEAQRIANEIEI